MVSAAKPETNDIWSSETNDKIFVGLLVGFAALFLIAAVGIQTLIVYLLFLPYLLLSLATLLFLPLPLFMHKGWRRQKPWLQVVSLIGAIVIWLPAIVLTAKAGELVNERRARAFIAEVQDYAARTGTVPKNEAELRKAGIRMPYGLFGGRMLYEADRNNVTNIESAVLRGSPKTNLALNGKPIKPSPSHQIDSSKPAVAVTYFWFAGWEYCSHLSRSQIVICGD